MSTQPKPSPAIRYPDAFKDNRFQSDRHNWYPAQYVSECRTVSKSLDAAVEQLQRAGVTGEELERAKLASHHAQEELQRAQDVCSAELGDRARLTLVPK